MIVRSHRFHGYHSLDAVYRRGETVRGPHTMLRFAANPKRRTYRAAVVVSKKVHKSAVVRNRIRRRIFEIIRQYDLGDVQAEFIVTVFDESVATIPADQLQKLIHKQLSRLPRRPAATN